MVVPALKYDPHSYNLNKHYTMNAEGEDGMDATGPFLWKFHRKLSGIPENQESMSPEEASIRAPRMLWAEVLVGSDEDIL